MELFGRSFGSQRHGNEGIEHRKNRKFTSRKYTAADGWSFVQVSILVSSEAVKVGARDRTFNGNISSHFLSSVEAIYR